jgi:hypothetical protein
LDIVGTLERNWPAVTAAPWAFAVVTAVISIVVWTVMRWRYGETVAKLKERIEDRDHEIARLAKQKGELEARSNAAEAEVEELWNRNIELVNEAVVRDRQLLDLNDELQKTRDGLQEAEGKNVLVEFVERRPAPAPQQPSRRIGVVDHVAQAASHVRKPLRLEAQKRKVQARRLTEQQKVELRRSLIVRHGEAQIIMDEGAPDAKIYGEDFADLFSTSGWIVRKTSTFAEDPAIGGLQVCYGDDNDVISLEFARSLLSLGIPFSQLKANFGGSIQLRIVGVTG